MKSQCRRRTFCAVLAVLSLMNPFLVSAQDDDMTMERAPEQEEEVEEVMDNGEFNKPADQWPKGSFLVLASVGGKGSHLGPTGLWGVPAGQNIWVKRVSPDSPADGKVIPDDVIYRVNGKGFAPGEDVKRSFSKAITHSETQEAGGKLVLDIRRAGKLITVPIQLKVMGSFSPTTPWNCEKSKNIVKAAEEYMRKGLRPETGLPNDGKYMYAPWNDSVLFLLASGNPRMQGLVRRYILRTTKRFDDWKAGVKVRGSSWPHGGWSLAYVQLLFGEYYHRTGDPIVRPYLEYLANRSKRNDWTWPPKPSGYGTHPNPQMVGAMGMLLAYEAGFNIDKKKLWYDLKYLHDKRAEYGHVAYNGYGAQPFSNRQIDAPEEITAEQKKAGSFSSMNGKPGAAAALYSMTGKHETAVKNCAERCVYAFNRTGRGHGGIWFNNFWTPIGALHAGQEKAQLFMKGQQWYRELYRDHTGSMWQTGNAKERKDTLGTGYAIHRVMHHRKLRMFGAPKSMFSPTAPAYMKPALAAHRSRDYARAEQLTRKLLADGTVPAKDKDRANYFLNSVKALKESVEYDLTFTEGLIKKGNFALASVELPQIEMVTSPNNPRVKAIAKALESPKAIAHIEAAKSQKLKDAQARREAKGAAKDKKKADFRKKKAGMVALIKDGHKYAPSGMRKGTFYPIYRKEELTRWRILVMKKGSDDAPEGWEQPGFDDSRWKAISLPSKQENRSILMRTTFVVEEPGDFKALRVRMKGNREPMKDFGLYLNGEMVAVGSTANGGSFELTPESFELLKPGKNTLALKSSLHYHSVISLRLEGILEDPSKRLKKLPDLSDAPDLFDSMDI